MVQRDMIIMNEHGRNEIETRYSIWNWYGIQINDMVFDIFSDFKI